MLQDGTNKYTKEKDKLINSNDKSQKGLNIPLLMKKYGSGFPRLYLKTYLSMIKSILLIKKNYKSLKHNPMPYNTKASDKFIDDFIQYTKSLGIEKIAFTEVPREYIFNNHSIIHKNAIVFTYEMNKESINSAPSKKSGHEVFNSYKKLSEITEDIAKYLRREGYSAQSNSPMGGDVILPELAERAGLGTIGLSGLLISPGLGPRQRIGAVYTSIENLPINMDNPYQWIRSFCDLCNKCVRKCPSNALQNPPIKDKYKKCSKAYTDLHGCSICVKECVFNNNDYNLIKNGYERKLSKL